MTPKCHGVIRGRRDLLHDRNGDLCCWFDLVYDPKDQVVMRGHRVLLYDPRGHGDLCGRRDLLNDPKGNGDLCYWFDLVYDPKMSRGH